MKTHLSAILLLLGAALTATAEDPATPATPGTPAPAAAPSASAPAAPAPPIVRLPTTSAPATPVVSSPAGPSVPTASPPSAETGGAQLGWSSDGVSLRGSTPSNLRTNRSFETRGSVPRLIKPQRRTFGGFLGGFANLFNPFAPTSHGVAERSQHLYDGDFHRAAVPHGFHDERSHEPSAVLFSAPLESDPTAPRKERPSSPTEK